MRTPCPIATFLDLWGDRWTLLILRDLFCGKTRFGEFEASPERIPPSILAQRLKWLAENGYVDRRPYSQHPPRHGYHLTEYGRSIGPVLVAMGDWSEAQLPGVWRMPDSFRAASCAAPSGRASPDGLREGTP